MVFRKFLTSFVCIAAAVPLWAAANQCAEISCDCSAISDQKWRDLCVSREKSITAECSANSGVLKSYCGLHGPAAFPVAISIKKTPLLTELDDAEKVALDKQIHTQLWSLEDSYKVLQGKESSNQYGEAIQLLTLYERDTDRLYELQKQRVTWDVKHSDTQKGEALAEQYANDRLTIAEKMEGYSKSLWQKYLASDEENARKAYSLLSLKLARLAANIYEQGADLLGVAGAYEASALAWQKAAGVAKRLISLEASSGNNRRHIEFYQAQASARLNRATFYWLQTQNNLEQVLTNVNTAGDMTLSELDQLVAEFASLHESDNQGMRAMRRKGR